MLTDYEKAAIIGYYRNGMTYGEIALLVSIPESSIKKIVEDYLENKRGSLDKHPFPIFYFIHPCEKPGLR